jgi:acetyl esterase/lipase
MSSDLSNPIAFPYKTIKNTPILLDLYPPSIQFSDNLTKKDVPAIIFFHGGGLVAGDRRSWFPAWLHGVLTFFITWNRD